MDLVEHTPREVREGGEVCLRVEGESGGAIDRPLKIAAFQ